MKPTRIHLAYVKGGYLRDYEHAYLPMVSEELRAQDSAGRFTLESDPAKADVIILWEGFEYKTPRYIETLENDPLVRHHAERVHTINYDDHPEGFLAGLYTSLEAPFFNSAIHRIRPFVLMNNPLVYGLTRAQIDQAPAKLLFSFTGAASHAVRKKLFEIYPTPTATHHVQHIKRWYDHGEAERQRFIQVALDSVFCLCPHGYCSYTPRITEVMAMARVPVIIADDWIPFSIDEKVPYYIKVPERDIAHLPDILAARRGDADEIRFNARALWEKYCAPNRRVVAAVECITDLAARTEARMSYSAYRERWHSREFLTQLGWTGSQMMALRIEQRVRRWLPQARIPGVSPLMRYRNAPNLK
jgi:hypothetical protein